MGLAASWRGVNGTLRGLEIAHNYLQHGNVMVQDDGALHLVDYDGVFLPRFQGEPSPEIGHRHYQHPKRTDRDYHAEIDNFPSLVVYLTMMAVGADPQLWNRFYNQENMLFTRDDFADPANSDCFKALKASPEGYVAELTGVLEEFCARPWKTFPGWRTSCAAFRLPRQRRPCPRPPLLPHPLLRRLPLRQRLVRLRSLHHQLLLPHLVRPSPSVISARAAALCACTPCTAIVVARASATSATSARLGSSSGSEVTDICGLAAGLGKTPRD